jgi:hypothetical protein
MFQGRSKFAIFKKNDTGNSPQNTKKTYDICNDDSVESVDGDIPQVSYDEYPASDIENQFTTASPPQIFDIPTYENLLRPEDARQTEFLQKINDKLLNSYELRSPEFPRTPSAARPEYFTIFAKGTFGRRDEVSYENTQIARMALENMFIESNSPISSDSDSDPLDFKDLRNSDELRSPEFPRTPSACVAEADSVGIQGNSGERQGVAESVGRSKSAIFGRDEVSYENQGVAESVAQSQSAIFGRDEVSYNNTPFQLLHDQVDNVFTHTKMNYKKITYEEIEKSLSKYYDKNNKYSNEMDILITFMRGQKHIYKESANVVQKKQYAITFTSLSITSLITVITPFIRNYVWSIILISGGNAIATVLMTALNYLRLDSGRNTFSLLSNHYEHFEHILELTNNKLLFICNESEQSDVVLEKIREIEFKMGETKELCPVIVPDEVRHIFPVICQTNIFSLIKKLELYRKQLIIQFKDIKNEIRYILYKWDTCNLIRPTDFTNFDELRSPEFPRIPSASRPEYFTNSLKSGGEVVEFPRKSKENNIPQRQREKTRLLFLMEVKERIKKELIEYKSVYNQIDDLFAKEIKYAEINSRWCRFYTRKITYSAYTNPVIKDHLDLIFTT